MIYCFGLLLAGSALLASNGFLHPVSVARVFVTSNAELAATKPYPLEGITPVTLVLHGNIAGGKSTLQFR